LTTVGQVGDGKVDCRDLHLTGWSFCLRLAPDVTMGRACCGKTGPPNSLLVSVSMSWNIHPASASLFTMTYLIVPRERNQPRVLRSGAVNKTKQLQRYLLPRVVSPQFLMVCSGVHRLSSISQRSCVSVESLVNHLLCLICYFAALCDVGQAPSPPSSPHPRPNSTSAYCTSNAQARWYCRNAFTIANCSLTVRVL
jgi:hypothetical protein